MLSLLKPRLQWGCALAVLLLFNLADEKAPEAQRKTFKGMVRKSLVAGTLNQMVKGAQASYTSYPARLQSAWVLTYVLGGSHQKGARSLCFGVAA